MIIEAREEFIEDVVEFSWEVFCDKTKCGFPKFKSYNEMYDSFFKAIKDKDNKVLVCYENKEIIGTINLLVIKDDKYLECIGGILAKNDFNLVATQFINYLKVNYSSYEIDFGYPLENKDAISFLQGINAKLMDSSITMLLKKDDFVKTLNYNEVELLEANYYDEYAIFHDKHNPNIYWTSEKIFDKFDIWKIYIIRKEEKIVGSIFVKVKYNVVEVFGISIDEEYKKQGVELKLLSESINDILKKWNEDILYFVGEDKIDELNATLELGFKQIDTYRSYKFNL